MHVVVFPGWYPNRTDKLSGDFIQRHMHAIAGFCKVTVVIPVKDNSVKKVLKDEHVNGNLTEVYYYYPSTNTIKFIDSIISFIRYNLICLKAAKAFNKEEKISLAHIYVLQKNHLLGLLLKWMYKIRYVISEQSTFYVDGRFEQMNFLQRKIYIYIFERAASFQAVSQYLQSVIVHKLKLKNFGVVIPNVVDSAVFFHAEKPANSAVTFVHVSNMVYQKNVDGMLKAFAQVKQVNNQFKLNLVGPMPSGIRSLIQELHLNDNVNIWNERTYNEVAEIMQQSDVFIFFTRYETFGCVIIEANACGLPVILSNLEVTRELIIDKQNGLFVNNEDIEDLSQKILYMIDNLSQFDSSSISSNTKSRFNYAAVGKMFYQWYQQCI